MPHFKQIPILFIILTCTTLPAFSMATDSIKHRLILIGAGGKKAKEYYALLKNHVQFVGFIQPNPRSDIISLSQSENVPLYSDLKSLSKDINFDGAIVAVPHCLHFSYTKELLSQDKFVIKEKPISLNQAEILEYRSLAADKTPRLFTVVQRQFQHSFIEAKKELFCIGKIYAFKYEYCLGLKEETTGWRAQRALSGGGVLLDAGYHVVDMLSSFFGIPSHSNSLCAYTLPMKQEKLEDTVTLQLSYPQDIVGIAIVSRYGPLKKECFEISGEHGTLLITPTEYTTYDRKGTTIKAYKSPYSKEEETLDMFLTYLDHVQDTTYIEHELKKHEHNIELIEASYKQN